jgi:hypothetical protein
LLSPAFNDEYPEHQLSEVVVPTVDPRRWSFKSNTASVGQSQEQQSQLAHSETISLTLSQTPALPQTTAAYAASVSNSQHPPRSNSGSQFSLTFDELVDGELALLQSYESDVDTLQTSVDATQYLLRKSVSQASISSVPDADRPVFQQTTSAQPLDALALVGPSTTTAPNAPRVAQDTSQQHDQSQPIEHPASVSETPLDSQPDKSAPCLLESYVQRLSSVLNACFNIEQSAW